MALAERFGAAMGTILDVQAIPITGITTISVDSVTMNITATAPKRTSTINLTIDGQVFQIQLDFSDETYNAVGLTGAPSKTPPPL